MYFSTATSDRLASSFFIAALLNGGLILGITFEISNADPRDQRAALDVVLTNSAPTVDEAVASDYLSTVNQTGSGNTRERVPVASEISTAAEYDNPGKDSATDPFQQRPQEQDESTAWVVSRRQPSQEHWTQTKQVKTPAQTMDPKLMRMSNAMLEPIGHHYNKNEAYSDKPQTEFDSVTTQASDVAEYLDRWKRKVEQIGTLNFPHAAHENPALRNPIVQVVVRADGSVEDTVIQRSSGSGSLDAAALQILRLAAPYEPFSDLLRAHYTQLEFVYEWEFRRGDAGRRAM